MTKGTDRDTTTSSAASAREEERDEAASSGQSRESGKPGEDEELALDVEVELPEPSLEERIAALEAKQKETYDRYLRAVAETDNVRKRTRKEVDDARTDAQSRVLREMLPVVDNLERALSAAGGPESPMGSDGHGIVEGVRLVLRQFAQALERCGVSPVAAEGAAFDPTQHEAVSQLETADYPPGTVVDVLQTGYRIGDRLLRPALVVVAKAPPAGSRSAGGGESGEGEDEGGGGGGGNGGAQDDARPGPNGHDPDAA